MEHVEIPVSGGHVAIVDASDADLVLQYNWAALPSLKTTYAQRSVKREDGKWTTQKLHTLITGYAITDHKNGNGLDNRRSNLRSATHAQNISNQQKIPGPSGFKGVTWWKRDGNWKAQITKHGKNYHLGYYSTPEAGARAHDEAARRLHGEFATLNFPEPGERSGLTKKES